VRGHGGPAGRRIAYVTSTFPKLSETFILREVIAIERAGIHPLLFSVRYRASEPVHADALPYLERTAYAPWFGLEHAAAFVSLTRWHPRGVASALLYLTRDMFAHARYPTNVAKTLLCMGKMFLYTREMERGGAVHVHAHFANIATTLAAFASRVLGISYSFTGHAWDIFVPVNHPGLREKISGAEFVATCTEFNVQYLERFARTEADRARLVRSYHGVDLSRYQPSNERDAGRILSGGRLDAQKGLHDLLEAAAILRARGVGFCIEMVGDGDQEARLRGMIARYDLAGCVNMVGSMPHERLMERMRTAAMVVLPSVETRTGYMDGIPNLLIESLALEVPVVSTRISGIPELVVDGETGVLVPPGDVHALADAIESLIRNPDHGRTLGRQGRARVAERFDLETNARDLAGRFERILARPM
jgi:glycosyltransferase involved in cell wall biosynthesis